MDLTGYAKIGQSGGTYITALFWNEEENKTYTCCVRDYDYSDCSRDNDELYYMPIDLEARKRYERKVLGIIHEGETVEVFKGRKVPIGTVSKVVKIYDWKDRYGRIQTRYAVLDNGMKTSVYNCRFLHE